MHILMVILILFLGISLVGDLMDDLSLWWGGGHYKMGIEALEEAKKETTPNQAEKYIEALEHFGQVNSTMDNHKEAVVKQKEAHLALGDFYFDQEQYKEALDNYSSIGATGKITKARERYVVKCATGTWVHTPAGEMWLRLVIDEGGTLAGYSAMPTSDDWGEPKKNTWKYTTAKYSDTGERWYGIEFDRYGGGLMWSDYAILITIIHLW